MIDTTPITVAITGASGVAYGLRLIEVLLRLKKPVDLILSDAARIVLKEECDLNIQGDGEMVIQTLGDYFLKINPDPLDVSLLRHFNKGDWMAPMASGSARIQHMIICPCSMGTLAAIARGMSDNLIERAADVIIKEKKQLILLPRETPLSPIHLENMLILSKLGVTILPASPGFYQKPQHVVDLIDFMVGRVLDHLGLVHTLIQPWPLA